MQVVAVYQPEACQFSLSLRMLFLSIMDSITKQIRLKLVFRWPGYKSYSCLCAIEQEMVIHFEEKNHEVVS